MGLKKGEPVAIAWLQGGMMNILKKRKSMDGIIKIDKHNAIKIPDDVTPRMVKLIKWLPFPKHKWYPLYIADPEHALTLEVIYRHSSYPKSFEINKAIKPQIETMTKKVNVCEAIPMLIKPIKHERTKEGDIKYGIETMSAENLSTFLEGKQESQLNRTVTDKFNLIIYVAMGAAMGFLLGQVIPLGVAAT